MKKLISVLLTLSLIAVLCACSAAAPEAPVESAAPAEETPAPTPEPTPEPREITKVEITAENFLDYFDYVVTPNIDSAEKDKDGNIVSMTVCYDYVLKPEYEAAWEQARAIEAEDFESLIAEFENLEEAETELDAEEIEAEEAAGETAEEKQGAEEYFETPVLVDFEVTVNDVLNPTEVDFEKLSYAAFDDSTEQTFPVSITADWWHSDGTLLVEGDSYEDASYKMTVLEFTFGLNTIQELVSIEILSASGTLYLYM